MPTPETTWYYVAGFAILGWACLAIFAGLRVGKVQGWWVYGLAVLGTGLTFIAGGYALATPPSGWVIAALGWSWVRFLAFVYMLISLVLLAAGLVPDQYLAISLGMNTAIFALFLPTLLAGGAFPGNYGNEVEQIAQDVQTSLMAQTNGAFG